MDAAVVSDTTVIKLETVDGLLFTPRYGPDRRPTIWSPDEWGGRTPRDQLGAAWEEIADTYRLERVYCDPWHIESDIVAWNRAHGEHFVEWHTNRSKQMHEALELFYTDIMSGALQHDGCPVTTLHVGNARKVSAGMDRYKLAKPSEVQKIDAAMASTLAHKAAVDARASGWDDADPVDRRVFCFT